MHLLRYNNSTHCYNSNRCFRYYILVPKSQPVSSSPPSLLAIILVIIAQRRAPKVDNKCFVATSIERSSPSHNGDWPAWSRDPNSSTTPLATHNSSNYVQTVRSNCISSIRSTLSLSGVMTATSNMMSGPSSPSVNKQPTFDGRWTKVKFREGAFSLHLAAILFRLSSKTI